MSSLWSRYKIYSAIIIGIFAILMSYSIFAASVKVVSEATIQYVRTPVDNQSGYLYFDNSNQLHLGFKKREETTIRISQICDAGYAQTYNTIITDPLVVEVYCSNKPSGQSYYQVDKYLVGLDTNLNIRWKNTSSYAAIIISQGANSNGIVLFINSLKHKSISIISPQTGEAVYPPRETTAKIGYESSAIYDPAAKIIYYTTTEMDAAHTQLCKLDLQTGVNTVLTKLPNQFLTRVPAVVKSIQFTSGNKYLVMVANIGSRLDGHDIFMIYDLVNNKMIYNKKIKADGRVIIDNGNNIGLSFLDMVRDTVTYMQFKIRD